MRCGNIDTRICDYLDGTLSYEERQQFDGHIASCPACAEKLADAELALALVSQSPRIDPPEELVGEILKTVGPAHTPGVLVPAGAGAGSRVYGGLRLLVQPLFEPRFAMSMAFALVSFSILTLAGQRAVERWRAEGTNPLTQAAQASREVDRLWNRGAAFVLDNLPRVVAPPADDNRPVPDEQTGSHSGPNSATPE